MRHIPVNSDISLQGADQSGRTERIFRHDSTFHPSPNHRRHLKRARNTDTSGCTTPQNSSSNVNLGGPP
jgi:hypothetical protein